MVKTLRLFPHQIILSSEKSWLKGIFRIVSASKGRKVALIKFTLHHFVIGSMREETIGNWGGIIWRRDNLVGRWGW